MRGTGTNEKQAAAHFDMAVAALAAALAATRKANAESELWIAEAQLAEAKQAIERSTR